MKIINENVDLNSLIIEAKKSLDKYGFYIAKNLIEEKAYKKARENSLKYFDEISKCSNKLNYPLRGNVSAGIDDVVGMCKNSAWYLFRSCFFTWNRPNYKVVNIINISRDLSSIRNLMKGLPIDYGRYIEKNDFIGYTSLSKYPNDGGFLKHHKDGTENDILHFKVELTHKGKDYVEGGFYVFDKFSNKKIDISALIEPCDVAFFDGSQAHGVDPIYGEKGRIAFFEIPTTINNGSRLGIYSNDGWNLLKRLLFKVQLLITPVFKKTIFWIIKFLP